MSGMNPFLAELYNTAENIGVSGDTEKLAQAQIMSDMLADEGINVDNLSADTIAKVASSLFGEDAALTKTAEEVAEEEKKEEPAAEEEKKEEPAAESAEEKTAEADYLGRLMAHAYVNELAAIEKQAGGISAAAEKAGKHVEKALEYGKGKLEALGRMTMGGKPKINPRTGMEEVPERFSKDYQKFINKGMSPGEAHRKAVYREANRPLVRGAEIVGGGTALTGGLGYGGYRAAKKKESAPSFIDQMAEHRAAEILKQASMSDEEKLAAAVEERAWQILEEQGYTK